MKSSPDKIAPRPPVNKLRPLRRSDSSVAGPDWSGFQVLYEDPEWLSKFSKNRSGGVKRNRSRGSSKITGE